jgi:hypothetical protein
MFEQVSVPREVAAKCIAELWEMLAIAEQQKGCSKRSGRENQSIGNEFVLLQLVCVGGLTLISRQMLDISDHEAAARTWFEVPYLAPSAQLSPVLLRCQRQVIEIE